MKKRNYIGYATKNPSIYLLVTKSTIPDIITCFGKSFIGLKQIDVTFIPREEYLFVVDSLPSFVIEYKDSKTSKISEVYEGNVMLFPIIDEKYLQGDPSIEYPGPVDIEVFPSWSSFSKIYKRVNLKSW